MDRNGTGSRSARGVLQAKPSASGPINADMLRGILDCMHAEADERDKHSAQIRSIVAAAKDAGFDTKAVRKVFVRERMDDADRAYQDDLIETYEHALGGKGRALAAIAAGVPTGEAAKANGVHRATLARARHVAKQASIATPHDPATGEIKETADDEGTNRVLPGEQAGLREDSGRKPVSHTVPELRPAGIVSDEQGPRVAGLVEAVPGKSEGDGVEQRAESRADRERLADPVAPESRFPEPSAPALDVSPRDVQFAGKRDPVITDDAATDAMLAARDHLESLKRSKGLGETAKREGAMA